MAAVDEALRVVVLQPDDWQLLRTLRLAALAHDGERFAGSLADESAHDADHWRELLATETWCLLMADDEPVGVLAVHAPYLPEYDCWISSVWVGPTRRGEGLLRRLIDWVVGQADDRGWHRLGLGVWADNAPAVAAFERLGFVTVGEPTPSDRFPGKEYVVMRRTVPGEDRT
jgi:RimJ/RimL family protein N-acetyltransferase